MRACMLNKELCNGMECMKPWDTRTDTHTHTWEPPNTHTELLKYKMLPRPSEAGQGPSGRVGVRRGVLQGDNNDALLCNSTLSGLIGMNNDG